MIIKMGIITTKFELIGYIKDYYIAGKFIVSETLDVTEKDREVMGYYGQREDIAIVDIKIGKKTIKKNTKYKTFMYPMNGKLITSNLKFSKS